MPRLCRKQVELTSLIAETYAVPLVGQTVLSRFKCKHVCLALAFHNCLCRCSVAVIFIQCKLQYAEPTKRVTARPVFQRRDAKQMMFSSGD